MRAGYPIFAVCAALLAWTPAQAATPQAAGVPAKVKKAIEGEAAHWIQIAAEEYVHLSRSYIAEGIDAQRT